MDLLGFFRRKSKPAGATRDQADKEEALKSRFNKASFGIFFRTRAFVILGDQQDKTKVEWREARYTADEGWTIWHLSRLQGLVEGAATAIEQRALPNLSGLTFFAAVEEMAQYEQGQKLNSYEIAEEPGEDFIAGTYVVAFAENEGIAFDVDGKPHPTDAHGEIVVNGIFPPEAYAKARAAAERKNIKVKSIPACVVPSFGLTDDITISLNQLSDPVNEMIMILYRLRDFTKEAQHYGWHAHIQSANMRMGLSIYAQHVYCNKTILSSSEKNFMRCINRLDQDRAEFADQLRKAFYLAQLQVCLAYARTNPERTAMDSTIHHIVTTLKHLGDSEARKDSPVLAKFLQGSAGYPKELDGVITWLEGIKKDMDAKVALESAPAQKALPPQP